MGRGSRQQARAVDSSYGAADSRQRAVDSSYRAVDNGKGSADKDADSKQMIQNSVQGYTLCKHFRYIIGVYVISILYMSRM